METQILNDSIKQYLVENPWLIFIIIWVLIWKSLALWSSARRGQKIWFVALLIVNTIGILEIGYLAYYYIQSKKEISTK